jgi:hypothetical protein
MDRMGGAAEGSITTGRPLPGRVRGLVLQLAISASSGGLTNLDLCPFFCADVDLLVTESDLRKGEGTRTGEAVSVPAAVDELLPPRAA